VNGVVRKAVIATMLTGIMMLLFLGSWRNTVIIAVSIPLSILSSVIILGFLGQTINIMTRRWAGPGDGKPTLPAIGLHRPMRVPAKNDVCLPSQPKSILTTPTVQSDTILNALTFPTGAVTPPWMTCLARG
jgi:hypothetical protein